MACAAAVFEDRRDAARARNRLRENYHLNASARYCDLCCAYHLAPTLREREWKGKQRVLEMVARGYTNEDIAAELHTTTKGVESIIKRLMNRWYLRNRVQLALFALVTGIVHPNDYLPPILEATHG